ncbi:MAG: GNAT family N-acetyltransferase [Ignavibacteria bacterium]|nr:GNAT family N-acetyltransferase [Ignavibacteria bacterium]
MKNTNDIDFYPAQAADIPVLLKKINKLYLQENTMFVENDVLCALRKLIDNEQFGNAWVINYKGAPAGYMIVVSVFSVEFKGETAFLDELFIEEEFRGKGIGALAVEFAEQYAARKGYKALRLEVEHANLTAQKLYRKKGFSAHERNIMTKWITGK